MCRPESMLTATVGGKSRVTANGLLAFRSPRMYGGRALLRVLGSSLRGSFQSYGWQLSLDSR